ncbi:S8 family serine peptidase [Gammaproteobacteria bacterium]|nr:S8 family serine peptidase [Gammaproteobacteria bacterium]
MPVIEVKSSDTLSTAVFDFATSTLQTDAQALANGTATAETISSYQTDVLNYIATDQNVDADELAPDVVAIADEATLDEDGNVDISPLNNDSYLTSAPISVAVNNGASGITSVTDNIVTYSPDADFNGSDAFDYTITQGDKTSSANVAITVNSVNDAPTFDNLLSTISVPENQTGVTSINVVDIDEDALTVSLLGTDKDSFNLSSENVLTFIDAPDYETKNTYQITLSVADASETTAKEVTILVTNVNDIAPVFNSDGNYSSAENQLSIGSIVATDVEGDTITYTVSGSDLAITNDGVLTFVSAPDYETKNSYQATVSANDGVNTTTQAISISITNVNDVAPVFNSDGNYSSAENQLSIGSIVATDVEGDTITYTVSGSDLAITNDGVLTFVSAPDYETKNSYQATVSANDGVNTTPQDLTINLINKLEDVISFDYAISNGTVAQAPILTTSVVLDKLTDAKSVYAILYQVNKADINSNIYCGGASAVFSLEKIGNTWKLNQELNPETSELCAYYLNYVINPYEETVETAPPTEGVHLSSGNKRLLDDDLQYSMYYYNLPSDGRGELLTITNPRSKNTFTSLNNYTAYLYNASGVYPSGCTTRQYSYVSNGETVSTPLIAEPDSQCFSEMVINISEDASKVKYEFSIYALDKISSAQGYLLGSIKDSSERIYGYPGREFEFTRGRIDSIDKRLVTFTYDMDKAILTDSGPANNDILYFQADLNDMSYRRMNLGSGIGETLNRYIFAGNAGSDADMTAPQINTVKIEPYTSSTEPERDFLKFTIDIENTVNIPVYDGAGVALTSVRDLWISTLNPYCEQKVFYVRDDLDGKIDVNTNSITATIPFLKNQRGNYKILSMNINDHGLAETNYLGPDSGVDLDAYHPAIGTSFTVGDGTYSSCPTFSTLDYSTISVDEEGSTFIGTFTANAGSDLITYSIEDREGFNSASDFLNINPSTGELNFNSVPDYEASYEDDAWNRTGDIVIVATSSSSRVARLTIRYDVNNINDNAPTIPTTSFSADENQTSIGCLIPNDADLATLPPPTYSPAPCSEFQQSGSNLVKNQEPFIYSISGNNLLIDQSGTLVFETAPDAENVSSYSAAVAIFDGVYTVTQDITVNVNDLNDNAPTVTDTSFTVNENQNEAGQIVVSDPDSTSLITYTIVSDYGDGSLFSVDANGLITFNSNPDYETKNTFTLKVVISDGTYSITKEFTINLNDLDVEIIPPSATSLNLLPKASNSKNIQLEGSVIDGRTATWSISTNGTYGTATIDTSGLVTYTTASTEGATEELVIKLSDGIAVDASAKLIININTDPLYKHQWHLDNTGQTNFATYSGTIGADLNVDSPIAAGYSGLGITVAVIDEGLELAHEDLVDNVVSGKSYDFLNQDYDPTNPALDGDHGTSVAGIIASRGWNNKGGRGVAPLAGLVGYNFLKYQSTSAETQSWGQNNSLASNVSIFNMSYGTSYCATNTYCFPSFLSSTKESALMYGVANLRSSKGGLYVKSSGNGFRSNRTNGYSCGENNLDTDGAMSCTADVADARHALPYVAVVGALTANDLKTSYSTPGPSLWVSSYGGEYGTDVNYGYGDSTSVPAIMTTDQSSCDQGYVGSFGRRYNAFNNDSNPHPENLNCNYVSTFNGTSSAAPNVSGAMALILEANPALTWRDVKHILASTSKQIDLDRTYSRNNIVQYEWETNAAGYKHHTWYGFGAIDMEAAINAALNYTAGSLGTFGSTSYLYENLDNSIADFATTYFVKSIPSVDGLENNFVEFVRLSLDFSHSIPRDIGIVLVSPQGTVVNVLQPFTNVGDNPSGTLFEIGVSAFYGEEIQGDWTMRVTDYTEDGVTGNFYTFGMEIYGH